MSYGGTNEGYSDLKSGHGIGESPLVRRFMEQDQQRANGVYGSSNLKTVEKSEFKNYQGYNNHYSSMRDLL
jgi:hypothetical protein